MLQKIIFIILVVANISCTSTSVHYASVAADSVVVDGVPYQASDEAVKKGYMTIGGKNYNLGLVYSDGRPVQEEGNQAIVNGVPAASPSLLAPTLRLLRSILIFF